MKFHVSFVFKGHTLLDRIIGADQAKLTASVEKHGRVVNKPLSHTDHAPAKASPLSTSTLPSAEEEKKTETQEELNARLRRLMDQDKVVLFMKGSPDVPRCGFSKKIVALLRGQQVEFKHFDILTDESVRQGTAFFFELSERLTSSTHRVLLGLKVYNDWPTFPQLIVKGELVGGLDIVQEMVENGELKELLKT